MFPSRHLLHCPRPTHHVDHMVQAGQVYARLVFYNKYSTDEIGSLGGTTSTYSYYGYQLYPAGYLYLAGISGSRPGVLIPWVNGDYSVPKDDPAYTGSDRTSAQAFIQVSPAWRGDLLQPSLVVMLTNDAAPAFRTCLTDCMGLLVVLKDDGNFVLVSVCPDVAWWSSALSKRQLGKQFAHPNLSSMTDSHA